MSSDSPMEKGEGEESFDDEEEEEVDEPSSSPEKRAKHAITGRGVTLGMLMADNIIEAGEAVLSLEYLGQKFTGDLLPSGKIKSIETGTVFGSPSSWAIFCKKLVNPTKKSGCGWASVKYKGRKLDSWKTTWLRQKRPPSPPPAQVSSPSSVASENSNDVNKVETTVTSQPSDVSDPLESSVAMDTQISMTPETENETSGIQQSELTNKQCQLETESVKERKKEKNDNTDVLLVLDLTKKAQEPKLQSSSTSQKDTSNKGSETDVCFVEEQEEALNLSLKRTPPSSKPKPEVKQESVDSAKDRKPTKHSALPDRTHNIDANTLVECERFSNMGKIQPFTVSMSTNSELLLDFHCHLTTSEVVGYLGGKWDNNTQHLSIQQAFPCRCRLGDSQNATVIEEEIRQTMKHLSMSLVGWYHSHPYCLPEPSVKDVDCQMAYQLRMKGAKSNYFPCVGIINSPYYGKSQKTESSIQMYMVMPPPEPIKSDYGIPMHLKYSVKQNQSVSEDLLSEMKKLTDFYRGSPDWIKFRHSWHPSVTYLEKLKTSLTNKLPEDQMDNGTFLDFVQHILTPKD